MAPSTDLDATTIAEGLLASLEQAELGRSDDAVALAAALQLATRAATLVVVERLSEFAGSYPASIQTFLTTAEPEIAARRDAALEASEFLGWRDVVDMLCDESLPCVAPRLHRGWQDKKQSCRQARRVTRSAVGFSLNAAGVDGLLLGLAIQNRLFLAPPPVRLDAVAVRRAYESVLSVIGHSATEDLSELFQGLVERLRAQGGD